MSNLLWLLFVGIPPFGLLILHTSSAEVKRYFVLTSAQRRRKIVHMLTLFQQYLDSDGTIKPCQNGYVLAGLFMAGTPKRFRRVLGKSREAGSTPVPASNLSRKLR
jgi:hypothetical protein